MRGWHLAGRSYRGVSRHEKGLQDIVCRHSLE
jgi:hypothetical protein